MRVGYAVFAGTAMGLSQSERRQLAIIEERLEREAIGLAHNLRTMSPPRRRFSNEVLPIVVLLIFLLLVAAAWASGEPAAQDSPQRDTTSVQETERYTTTDPANPYTFDQRTHLE